MGSRFYNAPRQTAVLLLVLSGMALISLVVYVAVLMHHSHNKRTEARWMVRATRGLFGVYELLECHEKMYGRPPSTKNDLIYSGCLSAAEEIKPSWATVYELPLVDDPGWFRIDEVMIRKEARSSLSSDAVIAVMLPHYKLKHICFVLLNNGNYKQVMWQDWVCEQQEWRSWLGGADLWPETM